MSSSVQRAAIFLRLRTSFPVKSEAQLYCCRPKSTTHSFATRCLARSYTNNGFHQAQRHMSSSGSDDGDEFKKVEKAQPQVDKTNDAAKNKLNDLLQSILKDTKDRKTGRAAGDSSEQSESEPSSKKKVDLAVPAKVKVTHKERVQMRNKIPDEVVLGKRVMAAVRKVASTLEGDPEQIESELVQKLKSQSARKLNVSEVVEGMKVDQPNQQVRASALDDGVDIEGSRAERVRRLLQASPRARQPSDRGRYTDRRSDRRSSRGGLTGRDDGLQEREVGRVNLFDARPLDIFRPQAAPAAPPVQQLTTWDRLAEKELRLAATHPPTNGFEEMIVWTEKNMLWKFPLDNEQGIDEEAKWSFADHVFLDDQIESWCPDEGAVHIFMELVCVALAKNSYLTVPEKREFLNWYRDYFRDKAAILKETGAGILKEEQQQQEQQQQRN